MSLSGHSITHTIAGLYVAEAFEKLTVSNVVKILSANKYTKEGKLAKRAFITVETASLRYKHNGDNPTSSEGHIARPNSVITIVGTLNIKNFKAIRTGSTSSVLMVTYGF